jgi:hypothetical protein
LLQPPQQRVLTHLTLQQLDSQQLLSQPQPLEPSMRSSRSNPKLWVQAAMLSTNEPTKMFHFIERRLLNTMEPSNWRMSRSGRITRTSFALPWGSGSVARDWTGARAIQLPGTHFGFARWGRFDAA